MSFIALWLITSGAGPFAAAAVAESELATMRGGFRLPSGIDVALTVQTQTAVDGAVLLRTVFQADQGPATVTVYVPRSGTTVEQPDAASATSGGPSATMPSVSFDTRGVINVLPGVVSPSGVSVTSGHQAGGLGDVPAGMEVAGSAVNQQNLDGLRTAELSAGDLNVIHFAGRAFGSAIINTGSDRLIETQTNVSIDLRNAGPDVLGSSMIRAQDLTFDALSLRGR